MTADQINFRSSDSIAIYSYPLLMFFRNPINSATFYTPVILDYSEYINKKSFLESTEIMQFKIALLLRSMANSIDLLLS